MPDRCEQALGEPRAWIVVVVVQIVHMPGRRVAVLDVHREEKRDRVVGACTTKSRDGRGEGLEIEVAHRRDDAGEGAREVIVDESATLTHRAANDALQWSQRKVRRDIADLLDPRRFEFDAALGGKAW